jgi:hypothetical protein
MDGAASRICQPDGTWAPAAPVCGQPCTRGHAIPHSQTVNLNLHALLATLHKVYIHATLMAHMPGGVVPHEPAYRGCSCRIRRPCVLERRTAHACFSVIVGTRRAASTYANRTGAFAADRARRIPAWNPRCSTLPRYAEVPRPSSAITHALWGTLFEGVVLAHPVAHSRVANAHLSPAVQGLQYCTRPTCGHSAVCSGRLVKGSRMTFAPFSASQVIALQGHTHVGLTGYSVVGAACRVLVLLACRCRTRPQHAVESLVRSVTMFAQLASLRMAHEYVQRAQHLWADHAMPTHAQWGCSCRIRRPCVQGRRLTLVRFTAIVATGQWESTCANRTGAFAADRARRIPAWNPRCSTLPRYAEVPRPSSAITHALWGTPFEGVVLAHPVAYSRVANAHLSPAVLQH